MAWSPQQYLGGWSYSLAHTVYVNTVNFAYVLWDPDTPDTTALIAAAFHMYEGVLWTKIYLRTPFTTDHR